MGEVTLQQVLQCREDRVRLQERLREEYGKSVVCVTMNIAGPVKTSPIIERAFFLCLNMLERQLPVQAVLHREVYTKDTGCEAAYAVDMAPETLKEICVEIEEESPMGRLFDLDVLDREGRKLTRQGQRGCIVCGAPGRACAAGRLHTVARLQEKTRELLTAGLAAADRETIGQLAAKSLLEEVDATPKPGLVDRRNTGSHRDMTMDTFFASARTLEPYFCRCVKLGQETAELPPEETFARLRMAGMEAEQDMYRATEGVNTHKGAIFSLGILCGGLGRLWTPQKDPVTPDALMELCGEMTREAMEADFARMDGTTPGQRLYLQWGITGIRGEAARGFPALRETGLPAYQKARNHGLSREEAGIAALLHLITWVQDTNLLHRGGPEGAAWAAEQARLLLEETPFPAKKRIEELDDAFIARNLSAGGCADLLAAVYFLTALEQEGFLAKK